MKAVMNWNNTAVAYYQTDPESVPHGKGRGFTVVMGVGKTPKEARADLARRFTFIHSKYWEEEV